MDLLNDCVSDYIYSVVDKHKKPSCR